VTSGPARRAATTSVRVCAVDGDTVRERPDKVVTEEPMEIRLHGPGQEPEALAVTMRTPGNDFELAVGFCLTEGLLRDADALDTVAYCLAGQGEQEYNVVTVKLRHPVDRRGHQRTFVANASCGLCGKTTLDEVEQQCPPVAPGPTVARSVIAALPARLRAAQSVFDATGGLHAAARFTADGELVAVREDVGRHNALDKLVGHAVLERHVPLGDDVLMVSGRVSFEIVQKAAMAGIPVVCAVSAPSSLAIDAARRLGQTLVGFVRGDTANVYTHPERLDLER
jgi:FdhD protein